MKFLLACENGLCRANRVWLVALVADEAVAEEGSENIQQFCRQGTGWRRHEALNALRILEGLKQDVSPHMIDLGGDVTGNCISKLLFTILSAVADAARDPSARSGTCALVSD